MALTFATALTELKARGFSYLSDLRAGYFVNAGRAELDGMFLWPYRITTATGSAGAGTVAITDLGVIEECVDTANDNTVLDWVDRRELRRAYGDLTTTGTPDCFYVDNTTVRAYPVGGTLSVRYFKRMPDLTGVQTPGFPDAYHMLWMDLAARWAYKDSDERDMPAYLNADIERQLGVMVEDLLGQQIATPDHMAMRYASEDW